MKKIIKLIILIIMSLSVYFIYQDTKNSKLTLTSLGDGLSLGINSYGIKEYSYIDYYKDYLNKTNKKIVVNNYSKKDLSIEEAKELVINNKEITRTLMETNILIINLGYNDLLYKINLDNNLTNNKLTLIIKEIETNYNDLIKEIRKYNKNKIIVIGYYSPNNDNYYLNKGVIKLNKLLKNNKEVEYIETYNLLSNREIYFSNPNSNYPNRYGYKEISNSLSKVNYKK
jgi:hypothetical protein